LGFSGIDPVFLDCIGNDLGFDLALIGERLERRDRHKVAIHLEKWRSWARESERPYPSVPSTR